MKCNIIGAGRLGKNIALTLVASQTISSLFICNRAFESAHKACQHIGYGLAVKRLEELPAAEITWLCCNDDVIPHIVNALASQSILKPGSFVIHSSGVLNSSILAPLKIAGCSVASFHPLKAFKTDYLDSAAFNQVDCVLEGDDEVCTWLRHSFIRLGAYITAIKPENKSIYHAGASIASNYLITLAACSEELFLKAGLQPEQSRRMLINLMYGNLSNLQKTDSIAASLTGPLARGDIKTLASHLNAIENTTIQRLYKAAGSATLSLTQLTDEQKELINNLFST